MTEMYRNDRLYEILGVERTATTAEIKTAYRRLAKTTHPDAGGDPDFFSEINDAYVILIDPRTRQEYDRTGTIDRHTPAQLHRGMLDAIQEIFEILVDRIVSENIDVRSIAFLAMMQHQMDQVIQALEDKEAMLRREIMTLKDLKVRLSRRNQEKNAFTDSIDRRLPKKIEQLETNMLDLKIGRLCVEELSYYQDSAAFFHAMQASVYPHSTAASTNSTGSVFFSI